MKAPNRPTDLAKPLPLADMKKSPSRPPLPPAHPTDAIYYSPPVRTPESAVISAFRWVVTDELTRRLAGRAGWAASFFRNGYEVIGVANGYARMPWEPIDGGLEMDPDSRVMLASVSKPVTAIGWFALREDWNRARAVIGQLTRLTLPQSWPTVFHALKEVAVERFLRAQFGFTGHFDLAEVERFVPLTIEEVFELLTEFGGIRPALAMKAASSEFNLEITTTLREIFSDQDNLDPGPAGVTMLELMTHRNGLDYRGVQDPTSPAELTAAVGTFLSRRLITAHDYQNFNFLMARAIIDHLSGEPFHAFMRRRVFDPAGCATFSGRNDAPLPVLYYPEQRLDPLSGLGGPFVGAAWRDYEYSTGGFGWYAPVREVAKLFDAVARDVVLTTASRELMHTNGMGWSPGNLGGRVYSHNGAFGSGIYPLIPRGSAVSAVGAILPQGWTAAVVSNSSGVSVDSQLWETLQETLPVIRYRQSGHVSAQAELFNPIGFGTLRYATDATDPTGTSAAYDQPITLRIGGELRVALFDGTSPVTGVSAVQIPSAADSRQPDLALADATTPGLLWNRFTGAWDQLPNFDRLIPDDTGETDGPTIIGSGDDFGVTYDGFVRADQTGYYTFTTISDDGSRLWIGGEMVVDNDLTHGPRERSGEIWLARGYHTFKLWFFERGATEMLVVKWITPNGVQEVIPNEMFSHL